MCKAMKNTIIPDHEHGKRYLARMSCRTTCSAVGLSASNTSTASPGPSCSGLLLSRRSSMSLSNPPSLGTRSPSPYHLRSFGPAAQAELALYSLN